MIYVINALPGGALIGRTFRGRPATAEEVRAALEAGAESAIGHEATARALSVILGLKVSFARRTIQVEPGDVLLVAALRGPRLEEGRILTEEEVRERGMDFLRVEVER